MNRWGMFWQVARLGVAGVMGWLLLQGFRWVYRRSRTVGIILAIGILGRVILGLTLFWISYLQLPIFQSLHSGDGFWALMGDARGYYRSAMAAAEHGLLGIDAHSSSPFFTMTLGGWMWLVGVSPAAGLFLNLCLYVGLSVVLVWVFQPKNHWRRDVLCIVGVAAFSFSPVLVIHSTQPLKEDLFVALIAATCLGVLVLSTPLVQGRAGTVGFPGGLAMMALATYCLAGIRAYYAAIVWAALVSVLLLVATRQTSQRVLQYGLMGVLVLAVAWLGYWKGAGPYYRGPTRADLVRSSSSHLGRTSRDLVAIVEQARTGFLLTGGATNMSVVGVVRSGTPATAAATTLSASLPEIPSATEAISRTVASADAPPAVLTTSFSRPPGDRLATAGLATEVAAETPTTATSMTDVRAIAVDAAPAAFPRPTLTTFTSVVATQTGAVMQSRLARVRALPATRISLRDPVASPDERRVLTRSRLMMVGLAVVFVPVSLLKALSIIEFSGGQGLLPIADVDTIFLDLSLLMVVTLLYKGRRAVGDRLPFVVFGLTLSLMTAILLGYVVTNFGTLFRMKPIVAVPIWMLCLSLSHESVQRRSD